MPVRAVVFDLFDTLVDLRGDLIPTEDHQGRRIPASAREIHAAIAETRDVSFDALNETIFAGHEDFVKSHLSEGREVTTFERFSDVLTRLEIDDADLAERLSRIHMDALQGVVRYLDHHPKLLASLRERVRVGLCSNFSRSETAIAVLDEGNLRPHLDAVVVSDAFGYRKPRAEIFEETLAQLGVAASETLHVGDSLRADVGGASPLGIRTVWITRRIADPDATLAEHDGAVPDHVVGDLSELEGLLDSLA